MTKSSVLVGGIVVAVAAGVIYAVNKAADLAVKKMDDEINKLAETYDENDWKQYRIDAAEASWTRQFGKLDSKDYNIHVEDIINASKVTMDEIDALALLGLKVTMRISDPVYVADAGKQLIFFKLDSDSALNSRIPDSISKAIADKDLTHTVESYRHETFHDFIVRSGYGRIYA